MTASRAADTLLAMQHLKCAARTAFLALSLLSAGAASAPTTGAPAPTASTATLDSRAGAFGHFLAGRFAAAEADPNTAATELSRAVALDPNLRRAGSVGARRPERNVRCPRPGCGPLRRLSTVRGDVTQD